MEMFRGGSGSSPVPDPCDAVVSKEDLESYPPRVKLALELEAILGDRWYRCPPSDPGESWKHADSNGRTDPIEDEVIKARVVALEVIRSYLLGGLEKETD